MDPFKLMIDDKIDSWSIERYRQFVLDVADRQPQLAAELVVSKEGDQAAKGIQKRKASEEIQAAALEGERRARADMNIHPLSVPNHGPVFPKPLPFQPGRTLRQYFTWTEHEHLGVLQRVWVYRYRYGVAIDSFWFWDRSSINCRMAIQQLRIVSQLAVNATTATPAELHRILLDWTFELFVRNIRDLVKFIEERDGCCKGLLGPIIDGVLRDSITYFSFFTLKGHEATVEMVIADLTRLAAKAGKA